MTELLLNVADILPARAVNKPLDADPQCGSEPHAHFKATVFSWIMARSGIDQSALSRQRAGLGFLESRGGQACHTRF